MDAEVAEQIKRIRKRLFTDASKLLLALSFKSGLPPPTYKQLALTWIFLSIKIHVCHIT